MELSHRSSPPATERVAPRAGAWVGTKCLCSLHVQRIVAPRAGAWVGTGARRMANPAPTGRTPCGCVGWNGRLFVEWNTPRPVAPRAGAWVGTRWSLRLLGYSKSHPVRVRGLEPRMLAFAGRRAARRTPCGCVGWNSFIPDPQTMYVRRTPCGCVGWNSFIPDPQTMYVRRTPCGCVGWNVTPRCWRITPGRSHPVRVRGLERECLQLPGVTRVSHPVRVRGLEQISDAHPPREEGRTPCGCVGWNRRSRPPSIGLGRRTPCGCVGWNVPSRTTRTRAARRTPCGCVGWNGARIIRDMLPTGRTPCGCVGWNSILAVVNFYF